MKRYIKPEIIIENISEEFHILAGSETYSVTSTFSKRNQFSNFDDDDASGTSSSRGSSVWDD